MKKMVIFAFLAALSVVPVFSSDSFKEGERLFLYNQLTEASLMFEAAIEEDPANAEAYLYLGYIYEVKQDYESAVSILSKGLAATGTQKDRFYFYMANNYFKSGDFNTAADMYSKTIQNSNGFADPYLHRANCRVKTGDYSLAARDYRLYLNMKPDDRQRENIEKMIAMLELTMAEQEKLKQEEEQRRLAEEARQKALLDSVLNSLSTAGSDTTNLSAESENIEDIEIELDIED